MSVIGCDTPYRYEKSADSLFSGRIFILPYNNYPVKLRKCASPFFLRRCAGMPILYTNSFERLARLAGLVYLQSCNENRHGHKNR
jgi:hypothetical protein